MRLHLAFLVVLACPLFAFAQPLADKVPADAIAYVGWTGGDSMPAGYSQSHLKDVLDASNFRQLIDDFLPRAIKKLAENAGDEEVADVISAIWPALWKHPSAFYFGGVDFSKPDQPMPRLAVLCDAGADAPALLAAVKKAIAKAEGVPLKAEAYGKIVVLEVGTTPVADLINGKGAALAADPAFKAAMAKVSKDPAFALYVNFESALKLADQAVAAANDKDVSDNWPKVRDALGLKSLKRLACTAAFDAKDWSTQMFLDAPGPRAGALGALLDAKPLSADAYSAIPDSATMAMAGRLDLASLLDQTRATAGKIDPEAAKQIDGFLQMANQFIGQDIQKELLAPLGREWAAYTSPAIGGSGMMGFVVVNRLRDPAKAEPALVKLSETTNKLIADNLGGDMKLAFQQAKAGDLSLHYFAAPVVAPAWAVKDGNLYVSLYPQVTTAAAGHVAGRGKSILDNPSFIAVRKRLAATAGVNPEAISSFAYTDLPKLAPEGYQTVLMMSQTYLGMADMWGVKSPPMVLPPLNKVMPHLAPAGSITFADDAGWHSLAISPFPGAEMLASQQNLFVSQYMMMGAMMFPMMRAMDHPRPMPPPPPGLPRDGGL